MLAVKGYYDGTSIQLLEEAHAQKNQKVIVTLLDEYIEKKKPVIKKSVFGMLSEYANPALIDREENTWKQSAIEKHENN
jgi:hypothetical protein